MKCMGAGENVGRLVVQESDHGLTHLHISKNHGEIFSLPAGVGIFCMIALTLEGCPAQGDLNSIFSPLRMLCCKYLKLPIFQLPQHTHNRLRAFCPSAAALL